MTIDDVDVVEINEAFAAQVIPSARGIGVDPFSDKLNPHGGAIALGHPFGMTGARILATLLNGLRTGQGVRAGDDVHRRRPGHGDDPGAAVMTASRDRALQAETKKHNGHRPAPRVPEPRKPEDIPAAEPKVPAGAGGRRPAAEAASSAGPPGALRFASRLTVGPPQALLQSAPGIGLELLRIALGRSQVKPGRGTSVHRSGMAAESRAPGDDAGLPVPRFRAWTMWSPASAWRAWPPSGCASR